VGDIVPRTHILNNNEQNLHVGIVSESSLEHASGVTRSVREVTTHLMDGGHRVTIVCPSPAYYEYNGAEVIATKSISLKGFDVGHKPQKKFQKLFTQLGIDVLHVASPMDTPGGVLFLGGNAIRAANNLSIPIAAIYQTDAVRFSSHLGFGFAKPVVKKILSDMHNLADVNLAPSSASVQDLVDWGVCPETIELWGRGVDTEAFNPRFRMSPAAIALRESLAPNGEIIFGVVSRLEPEKRLHKLQIVTDIADTKLLIVGKGTEQDRLQEKFGPDAHFTGRLDGEELSSAYAAIDVFLFPSVTDTFAQVIQEAKASGIPAIAANRGGPRDLIEHGMTGFLYEPTAKKKKDKALREYAAQLTEDHELRVQMGKCARASVENRTWGNLIRNELVGHYTRAIDVRHGKK